MSACFHNPPLIQHDNSICVPHCLKTMGNHDDRSSMDELVDRLLNFRFILGVEGGCRFIQEYDRSVLQHRPGDGNALLLPT